MNILKEVKCFKEMKGLNSFKEVKNLEEMKGLESLQVKAEAYLEPKRASMMELFFVNLVNGLQFLQNKLHHMCSTPFLIDLTTAKVEEIIVTVTTRSISCSIL